MKPFRDTDHSLRDLDVESATTMITAAADIALVVDGRGTILDIAFGDDGLAGTVGDQWIGQRWHDTVTEESVTKVERLLGDAAAHTPPRWRHVNHLLEPGLEIPVRWCAVAVDDSDRVIAVGRDLRPMAELQQRMLDTQQSLERDYWRLRQMETRYRLLFQTASEALLVLDAASYAVLEANPAACELFETTERKLTGRDFPALFGEGLARDVQSLLAGVRAAGHGEALSVRIGDAGTDVSISATLLRQAESSLLLIRLRPRTPGAAETVDGAHPRLLQMLETVPDGVVVTDPEGRIVSSNAAFLDLAQIATREQARGESLDQWLGRPGVDLNVLLANLRQHGSVRLFSTSLQGSYGASADVEISAVALHNGERPYYGFIIRNVAPRLAGDAAAEHRLPRSVEQLTELVGRVPLKELVRESTDLIERLCIEAALELTGDNRASAAELLGLSRQSLYVKLRRYGLVEPTSNA